MSRQNIVDKDEVVIRKIKEVGVSLPGAAPAVDTSLSSTSSTSRPHGLDSIKGETTSRSVRGVGASLMNPDV